MAGEQRVRTRNNMARRQRYDAHEADSAPIGRTRRSILYPLVCLPDSTGNGPRWRQHDAYLGSLQDDGRRSRRT